MTPRFDHHRLEHLELIDDIDDFAPKAKPAEVAALLAQ